MDEDRIDTSRCPLIVCFITEFLGTALYIFAGCMAYLVEPVTGGPLLPALSFGLSKLGILQISVHLTPAYLNPALSLGMFILNKMDWKRLLIYLTAEYTGALAGYVVLELCSAGKNHPCDLRIHPDLSLVQGFFIEFMISCILMMCVAGSADERLFSDTDSLALRLGLVVAGLFFAAEPFTGSCLNPARSIPPCIYTKKWGNNWLYQLGPYTGMITGSLIYRFVLDHTHKYSLYSFLDRSEDS